MKDPAKVRLSSLEMELVQNANWILTKNHIQQKVMHLLGSIQFEMDSYIQFAVDLLPAEVTKISAKISKGENYQGLPYLILDQPRYFDKENIFAIRHLFWWGNFFSCTLHLSGEYKYMYEKKIVEAFDTLKEKEFFICINSDPWQHHFEEGNYTETNKLSGNQFKQAINNNTFIKLSKKISLQEWNHAEQKLVEISRQYISMLIS
jgi:hypothetical protein